MTIGKELLHAWKTQNFSGENTPEQVKEAEEAIAHLGGAEAVEEFFTVFSKIYAFEYLAQMHCDTIFDHIALYDTLKTPDSLPEEIKLTPEISTALFIHGALRQPEIRKSLQLAVLRRQMKLKMGANNPELEGLLKEIFS